MFARKRSNVGFEGSDAESTRTALEPSDFDSEDSEVEDESYDDSEYSDEEEEESDGPEEQDRVQEHTQKPFVTESDPKTDNQDLENLASGHQIIGDSPTASPEQPEVMTNASSTPATIPEPSNDESEESEYSDEEEDESYDESDYSDEEEEELDSDEEHEHSGDAEKPAAIGSVPENIEFGLIDFKKGHQEDTRTASDPPVAATGDQEVKSRSADLTNDHQEPSTTASEPPAAANDGREASNPAKALDDDQLSTTTAIEPSELDSDESDVEDESYDDSEYSDEEEEEYSDEEDAEETESDASMDQEASANVQHSESIQAETVTANGAQESSSDSKDVYQLSTTIVSEPVVPVAATDALEAKIDTSRSTVAESKLLVASTEDPETGVLTPRPSGAAPPGQQEVMTTTSSTPAVPEPSDHESDESDVDDESYNESDYSDEEEYESDDKSDYSDEEEEESDGLDEQEQPGVAQKLSDASSGPKDTKPGSSNPKNDHQEPGATVTGQKIKVEASSHSKAEVDDQISVKTALEPSECDSDDSDCFDEDEEESDSDGEQERPADTTSGSEDTKTCSSDLQNDRQVPEATVAATKVQETGTTVYHLLAARNSARNAARYGPKHSGGVLEGSDAESTRTALEPSDFDSEDSEVEDEDDSEYSDEEEEESDSDGDEPEGQGQQGDGQEPSGAQDKDEEPGEPASGSQETGQSGNAQKPGSASSSGKQKSESKGSDTSGGSSDPSGSSDDDSNGSENSSEDSDYSDEEEEEYSDEEEEEKEEEEEEKVEEPKGRDMETSVGHSEKSAADVQGSGTSIGSPTTVTPNLPKTVLSNDIFPICLQQCPAHRQFIFHALNLRTQEIGAYILATDGNLEEVRTPLQLNFRNYSEFKKGDWVIGNGEVNYELDANSRLQKFEYSQERKTFVKCEHGVVRMLAEKEVNSQPPKKEVLQGAEAVAKTNSRDSKVNDEESDDSEIEDASDGSEETGDDMEDEEVSDEEDPFVYNPGARQEEPVQGDPDESLPTARPIRFRVPFLQTVNLNDTANMSDIPLTSPDESFAETSGDDSQYCMMTNDDVLLTKHQKDPNQNCCIS
ncbi:unnamed protein product [Caenorhabditis brenneri]